MREKLLELARALHALANSTGEPENIRLEPTKDELLGEARHQFKTRLLREAHFEGLPFHETGWEILLELYIAEAEGRKLNVTAIGLDGHIPTATLVRWIALLEQRQLLVRQPDTTDRRRTWISLTALGIEKLDFCLWACIR
ncbi:MarR family transcriptional regulator [Novosphingobium sp. AAP83]|uniref:MarR family transcriptional regulator n=1 Tax=Novosphingobium sp. AAP83 TaxID=1523425 RepID=UPI0006B8D268|nr:MarR family transcriptional regulator [Novosphingobium sp. AAP83]